MELYFMQHGEALPKEEDPERSLSQEGEYHVRAAGMALVKLGTSLGGVISSSKKRAVQTARAVAEALGLPDSSHDIMDVLDPLTAPEEIVEALKRKGREGPFLLAGHLPSLAELAAYLMDCQGRIAFRMGGVGCIQVEEWKRNGGTLLWYLTPEQLKTIAG